MTLCDCGAVLSRAAQGLGSDLIDPFANLDAQTRPSETLIRIRFHPVPRLRAFPSISPSKRNRKCSELTVRRVVLVALLYLLPSFQRCYRSTIRTSGGTFEPANGSCESRRALPGLFFHLRCGKVVDRVQLAIRSAHLHRARALRAHWNRRILRSLWRC